MSEIAVLRLPQMHFLHLTGKRVVFCMQDVNLLMVMLSIGKHAGVNPSLSSTQQVAATLTAAKA